ncbi:hypothetical protein GF323_03575 [Candidatus Woesearchaeota archaeon]|nr:hypothetical protein [Candidatus Woesearchaeota archaeon]
MKQIMIGMLIALVASAAAIAQGDYPGHAFWGEVLVNGNSAPDNLLIIAMIDGNNVSFGYTDSGVYGQKPADKFYVPNPGSSGKTIEFYVGGIKAAEHPFIAASGTELDLSVDGDLSICGDNTCSAGETCSTCPEDCGSCPNQQSPPSGGGGSPSGGGGSSISFTQSDECTPEWECTSWLECNNGVQKRVCTDKNECGDDTGKPAETRDCEIPDEMKSQQETETKSSPVADDIAGQLRDSDRENNGLSGITGLAIANLGKGSTWIGLLLIAAIVVAGIFAYNNYWKK